MRFYHLAPETLLTMPQWQLALLAEQMTPVYAIELLDQMTVTMAPMMEHSARMRLIRQLERMTGTDEPEPIEIIEHDPAKAAEWLRERGWEIVSSA